MIASTIIWAAERVNYSTRAAQEIRTISERMLRAEREENNWLVTSE
jgi:hypothetical protein